MYLNGKKLELITSWYLKFLDPESKYTITDAEKLCSVANIEQGEFKRIINGAYKEYSFSDLLEINKILNNKSKIPFKRKS